MAQPGWNHLMGGELTLFSRDALASGTPTARLGPLLIRFEERFLKMRETPLTPSAAP